MTACSFAEFVHQCPESDFPLLRELLSYDMRCPTSCVFARGDLGNLSLANVPSPLHWSRQVEWPWVLRNAKLTRRDTVLDVGGGWSVLKYAMADRCKEVLSVEVDREFIEKTQHSIELLGFDNIRQVEMDARKLLFPSNYFDVVTCVSVLEHIEGGHDAALAEMVRVLRPGGRLLLTMDLLYNGEAGTGGFNMLLNDGERVLRKLGVTELNRTCTVADVHGTQLLVLMIYYVKP